MWDFRGTNNAIALYADVTGSLEPKLKPGLFRNDLEPLKRILDLRKNIFL